ncbi:MAG: class II glutamine amidotransferase [Armatimonadota bacterium]
MCGLAGVLISKGRRSEADLGNIRSLFTRLLVESEHRGSYATGAAVISGDGTYRLVKEPLMASEFVETDAFRQSMNMLCRDTTLLMGHTRYPTRGSHLDNSNNHPLISNGPVGVGAARGQNARVLLCHNGHVSNHTRLFEMTGLRREVQVDSEILLRFAERNIHSGGIDIHGLADDLSRCRGKLSLVAVSTNRPDQVLLIKGNMPLELWHNKKHRLLAYASETQILEQSVGDADGWRALEIPPWSIAVVDTRHLLPIRCYAFTCRPGPGARGETCR